jgi:hypothetical protein
MILDQDNPNSPDRHYSQKARVWRENPSRTRGRWTLYGTISDPAALAETNYPDSMGWPLYIEHKPASFLAHNVGGCFLEEEIDSIVPSDQISIEEWRRQGLSRIIITNGNIKTIIPGQKIAEIEKSAGNITFWFKRKNGEILPSTYDEKKIRVSYITQNKYSERN